MAGIIGAVGAQARERCRPDFLSTIDLLGTGETRVSVHAEAVCAATAPSPRLLAERLREDDEAIVAVAGQVVADPEPDWLGLLARLREDDLSGLMKLSGRFALAVVDRRRSELYLISDRLGQYPLYVAAEDDALAFSTSQASFCRWQERPVTNPAWFHELFLANFSASHGSFLQGVRRLEPATVLRVGPDGRELQRRTYAAPYRPRPTEASEQDDVRRATAIFQDRVPRYVRAHEHAVLGLTSGFDSRTVLALVANHPRLTGFTYGLVGCNDQVVGSALAEAAGLRHESVPFDEAFESELGKLIVETVWLSGGLQSPARATLLAAYRLLLERCPDVEVILSGVSGDQLFRGHGNVPSIVSPYLDALFRLGRYPDSLADDVAGIFVEPEPALAGMERLRLDLQDRYGDPRETAAHIGYLTYEAPAEYFAGEACLADNFADFRTPFCDRDVVELAYTTRLSSLSFSHFRHPGIPNLQKNYLVANIISSEPRVAAVPIQQRPVHAFAAGRRSTYLIASAISRLRRLLGGARTQPHLEDWKRWFAGPMRADVAALLAPGARCESLIHRSFIDRSLATSDPFWLNKLITAELVLRLIEHRWRPDALLPAVPESAAEQEPA